MNMLNLFLIVLGAGFGFWAYLKKFQSLHSILIITYSFLLGSWLILNPHDWYIYPLEVIQNRYPVYNTTSLGIACFTIGLCFTSLATLFLKADKKFSRINFPSAILLNIPVIFGLFFMSLIAYIEIEGVKF